jgi:hypothetical protein
MAAGTECHPGPAHSLRGHDCATVKALESSLRFRRPCPNPARASGDAAATEVPVPCQLARWPCASGLSKLRLRLITLAGFVAWGRLVPRRLASPVAPGPAGLLDAAYSVSARRGRRATGMPPARGHYPASQAGPGTYRARAAPFGGGGAPGAQCDDPDQAPGPRQTVGTGILDSECARPLLHGTGWS